MAEDGLYRSLVTKFNIPPPSASRRDHVELPTGKRPSSLEPRTSLARWLLAAQVHGDAFQSDPSRYVMAIYWRMRGLRVRSRNSLAELMGRSPRAYKLWIARSEPKVMRDLLRDPDPRTANILITVDCTCGSDGLSATLMSVEHSDRPAETFLIGEGATEGSSRADPFEELRSNVQANGTWLCVVTPGDQLAPNALDIYARAIAEHPERWVIYADDDLTDGTERRAPHLKCEWNPDLFEHHDFVAASAVIRVTRDMLVDLRVSGWVRELTKRAVARGNPVHLPAILHHRRARPEPVPPGLPEPIVPQHPPLVSVIVPTRNGLSLLRTCLEGVCRTDYPRVELLVVDNDSDDPDTLDYLEAIRCSGAKVLKSGGPFNFSALNNAAVRCAAGEMLCFLNNDIEITDPNWLALLVRQAIRPDIGAVGARLLYPDGTIQHAGVVTGVGGGAAHAHRFKGWDEPGYFMRDRLPQRVSAVTAACMVMVRDKFLAVGGFNERDFPVAFNDVDLCLKLNSRGWQSFYEPRAVLVHHESKSRGSDRAKVNRERFAGELRALKRIWRTDESVDPYHHPQLSPFSEQFQISV